MKTVKKTARVVSAAILIVSIGAACERGGPRIDELGAEPHRPDGAGIVGGEETSWQSWRGVVGLLGQVSLCTGALIDPEVVLTAGHCVYLPEYDVDYTQHPEDVTIVGGADLFQQSVTLSAVSAGAKHPYWNGDISQQGAVDLGMLQLADPLDDVESYLLREHPHPEAGDEGLIVGYGLFDPHDDDSAGTHRWGSTELIQIYESLIEIGGETGTCSGDSGGPLFTQQGGRWVISGVNSFVESYDCPVSGGSWDFNTLSYRGWIEQVLYDWTGHGLPENPGTDADTDSDSETGTGTDTDSDSDTESDSDSKNTETDGGAIDVSPPADSGCGCSAVGVSRHGAILRLTSLSF